VVLTSRSGRVARDGQGLAAQLERLEASNTAVEALPCDVGHWQEAVAMLQSLKPAASPADAPGVLHAAGLLKDGPLDRMSRATFLPVVLPKALGAWHVHCASSLTPLEALLSYSSVASTFGNVGQANYATGNASLDSFALARSASGLAAGSLQIPLVKDAGMGAATFDAKQMTFRGMNAITLDQYAACVAMQLGSTRDVFGCSAHSPLPMLGLLETVLDPKQRLFLELAEARPPEAVTAAAGEVAAQALSGPLLSYEEVEAIVFEQIFELTNNKDVTLDTPLDATGLDSMSGMELRNSLETRTGTRIDRDILLVQDATVGDVIRRYHAQMAGTRADEDLKLSDQAAEIVKTEKLASKSNTLEGAMTFHSSVSQGALFIPAERLPDPILFVLSSPRSGSSLMQLCLNAHPQLFAGQELYLIMYKTLGERKEHLPPGTTFYNGLITAMDELWQMESFDKAEERVNRELGDECLVSEAYRLMSQLAKPRIFVDKTPANCYSILFLIRAQLTFEKAKFLHIIRHPYAMISSGLQLFRDYIGIEGATWGTVESSSYTTINDTADHLNELLRHSEGEQGFLRVRYEDFVADPARCTRSICEDLLAIPWFEPMQNPYTVAEALASFQSDDTSRLSVMDPKLLTRKSIDPRQAEKWREIAVPQRLQPETVALAHRYGYELPDEALPPEVAWLTRAKRAKGKDAQPPVLCVHDFTGLLWGFRVIAPLLKASCVAVRCSTRLQNGCANMYELAKRYLDALPADLWAAGQPCRIVAYSLGCRIAYWMAALLEAAGRDVRLVVLDGPLRGDDDYGPRMGGAAPMAAVYLRHKAAVELIDDSEALDQMTQFELSPDPRAVAMRQVLESVLQEGPAAAAACASLVELPDVADAAWPRVRGPTLVVCPENSVQRENGTLEQIMKVLPQAQVVSEVSGTHFNFVTMGGSRVAEHVLGWDAWSIER